MKIPHCWRLLVLAFFLSACVADTTPVARIHAAASVPRFVDVNHLSFTEGGKHIPVGVSAGFGYGTSWSDVGNVYGAQIFHVGVHYRNEHFAAGWTPFFGIAAVSHEGTSMFGHTFWYSLTFGGGETWRFSYQNSYTVSNKVAEDKGCKNADASIFDSSCLGKPESATRAEVNIRDVGFVMTAERNIGGHNSILVAPSLHWTDITGSNKLDVSPVGDFTRHDSFWSPALQLGYVVRMGERFHNAFIVMAGAEYAKTFRPDRVTREWVPSMDVKWQF